MGELLTKKLFKKGETMVREGAESYNLYIVVSGEATVIKSYLGKKINVRILKKGDVFGALSLITDSSRAATVVAKTDMEVSMIYREDFISILEKLPPEVNKIMRELMDELRATYKLNSELVSLTMEMLDISRRIKSLDAEKLKESLSQVPEVVQTIFVSLESSLKNMIHNFYTLANQLDKSAVKVDELFKQSFGQNPQVID